MYNNKGDLGGKKFKGGVNFNVEGLWEGNTMLKLWDEKKKRTAGMLEVVTPQFSYCYELVDYLKAGVKITADFFINFSDENMADRELGNLHDLDDRQNPYLNTMREAHKVLKQYTTESKVKKIPYK